MPDPAGWAEVLPHTPGPGEAAGGNSGSETPQGVSATPLLPREARTSQFPHLHRHTPVADHRSWGRGTSVSPTLAKPGELPGKRCWISQRCGNRAARVGELMLGLTTQAQQYLHWPQGSARSSESLVLLPTTDSYVNLTCLAAKRLANPNIPNSWLARKKASPPKLASQLISMDIAPEQPGTSCLLLQREYCYWMHQKG